MCEAETGGIAEFLAVPPFSLDREEKRRMLGRRLRALTELHYGRCEPYRRMLDARGVSLGALGDDSEALPFLPVGLFKQMELRSVAREDFFKTMTSSGTSGQAVSKIYLDRETASHQQKALVKIVSSFTGTSRLPMLILDAPSVVKDRYLFSARGAGVLGFSIFGADRTYALGDDMALNIEAVAAFLERHQGERLLLFGFTFMVWQHFYQTLVKLAERGTRFDLSNALLIHGGGWKKLVSESVSPAEFKRRLTDVCGLCDIHDYYGMVEQTGCVYMECEQGHLPASVFSDVITRRALDFTPCDFGVTGILQVVSALPESYPGHSLLTEDEGVILGEDGCPCGRKGKYFHVKGRLANAEIRGCSDTYASQF